MNLFTVFYKNTKKFPLPSLSLINIINCTADTKVTPASVHGLGIAFWLVWISLLHSVVKGVLNRTAQFRCFFGSTDGYGIWNNWVLYVSWVLVWL